MKEISRCIVSQNVKLVIKLSSQLKNADGREIAEVLRLEHCSLICKHKGCLFDGNCLFVKLCCLRVKWNKAWYKELDTVPDNIIGMQALLYYYSFELNCHFILFNWWLDWLINFKNMSEFSLLWNGNRVITVEPQK